MKNKYILNEKPIVELLSQNKIVVVDGGARGKVFPPLNQINTKIIKILRFEPEPDADIIHHANDDITFNNGLWHSKGKIDLNIAIEPSASSTYPFNVELQKNIDPHLKVRKTKKKSQRCFNVPLLSSLYCSLYYLGAYDFHCSKI